MRQRLAAARPLARPHRHRRRRRRLAERCPRGTGTQQARAPQLLVSRIPPLRPVVHQDLLPGRDGPRGAQLNPAVARGGQGAPGVESVVGGCDAAVVVCVAALAAAQRRVEVQVSQADDVAGVLLLVAPGAVDVAQQAAVGADEVAVAQRTLRKQAVPPDTRVRPAAHHAPPGRNLGDCHRRRATRRHFAGPLDPPANALRIA